MRGLDHRSRAGRGRGGRRDYRSRSARGDCRFNQKLYWQIFAATLAQKMKAPLIFLVGLSIFVAPGSRAQDSAELAAGAAPLLEGVPQVAVARLQVLLDKNLSEPEWQAVAEKLAEALMASNQPAEALHLLDHPRLRAVSSTKFWRAQALAALRRPAEAVPLYREVTANERSPFHAAAIFGEAEMLRALGRADEALQKFSSLFRDQQR